ncbi:MAG TPA: hypothetical protein VM030_03605 [Acidimicrobiales bacterium]|nr:hypothetical protein [Acidimicrobiales bacterium]
MRRTVPAIVLAMVLLIGGACGRGGQSSVELLSAAPDRTLEAGSSRLALTITTKATQEAQGLNFGGEGLFDYRKKIGQLTFDLGSLGLPGASGKAEMLLLGSTMYMKFPGAEATLKKKPWVKFDLNALAEEEGALSEGLSSFGQGSDPSSMLQALRGVSGPVKKVGEEKVRDAQTTHYRTTVDLKKAGGEVPAAQKAEYDRFVQQSGVARVPTDIWVDGKGRARRLTMEFDLSKAAGALEGGPGRSILEIELFDFGVAVALQEPPARQVTNFDDIK